MTPGPRTERSDAPPQAHTIAQRPRARDAGCPRSACGCGVGRLASAGLPPGRGRPSTSSPELTLCAQQLASARSRHQVASALTAAVDAASCPQRPWRPAPPIDATGVLDRRACPTLRGGPHEDRRPARARRRPRVVAGVRPHQPALQPTLPRHYPGDRAARTLRARSPSTMGGTPPVDGAGRQATDLVVDLVRCPGLPRFPAGLAPAHRPRIALRFAARRRTVVAPRCDERPRIATIPKLAGAYGVPDVETTDEG